MRCIFLSSGPNARICARMTLDDTRTAMLKLNLGVVDVGYTGESGAASTGDVAQILEDRYHIMRVFYEANEEFISEAIANDMSGSIESMLQGAPASSFNLATAMSKIEARFREWLDSGELQRMLPQHLAVSSDTLSRSSRRKSGQMPEGQQRQAFIDTGLFQASFRAWLGR